MLALVFVDHAGLHADGGGDHFLKRPGIARKHVAGAFFEQTHERTVADEACLSNVSAGSAVTGTESADGCELIGVGVGLPGHFVVAWRPSQGEQQLIDVFERVFSSTRTVTTSMAWA